MAWSCFGKMLLFAGVFWLWGDGVHRLPFSYRPEGWLMRDIEVIHAVAIEETGMARVKSRYGLGYHEFNCWEQMQERLEAGELEPVNRERLFEMAIERLKGFKSNFSVDGTLRETYEADVSCIAFLAAYYDRGLGDQADRLEFYQRLIEGEVRCLERVRGDEKNFVFDVGAKGIGEIESLGWYGLRHYQVEADLVGVFLDGQAVDFVGRGRDYVSGKAVVGTRLVFGGIPQSFSSLLKAMVEIDLDKGLVAAGKNKGETVELNCDFEVALRNDTGRVLGRWVKRVTKKLQVVGKDEPVFEEVKQAGVVGIWAVRSGLVVESMNKGGVIGFDFKSGTFDYDFVFDVFLRGQDDKLYYCGTRWFNDQDDLYQARHSFGGGYWIEFESEGLEYNRDLSELPLVAGDRVDVVFRVNRQAAKMCRSIKRLWVGEDIVVKDVKVLKRKNAK